MQTLPSGIKKVEASDNATVANFNVNVDLLDAKIAELNTHETATTGIHGATSAGTANKLMIRDANGRAKVAAPSSADDIARKDTVDALLISPVFTGMPTVPTAAADTNTTQVASTAFVIGQGSNTLPAMDGAVTIGTSARFAKADHVHPADTSKAPLASPIFTGIATAPYFKATGDTTRNLVAATWADLSANTGGQALLANNAYTDGNNSWKYSNTHASLGARGIRLSVSGGIESFDTGAVATTADAAFTPTWVKMASLLSPAFTGTPTVPTAAADTNTAQAASTAFVIGQNYMKKSDAIPAGSMNSDISNIMTLLNEVDTRGVFVTRVDGSITKIEEKDGSTVVRTTVLNRVNGLLSTIVQTVGGKVITYTIVRDSSNLIKNLAKSVV
ncbi:hypothetical protein Back11_12130 [Paenibacillus baekrokdamisoli]|uniref:Uncharacterized protein n=1 Tax=Paenibacillus baekrokdamisoli TaxID=1712516 RepID=A0A3G9J7R3_9BACL|nr:hypothetical protein [Paenibacillus baekrokdamisoli]MBB3070519.1 hypothetical protein [Paenibacillus baekrokdamisoli]BBH19868.1 hypothetical protein Back11_12130 [Paenibacillus baekrokdamisoli]